MRYNIFCFFFLLLLLLFTQTNKKFKTIYKKNKNNKLNKTHPPKELENGICVLFGGYVETAGVIKDSLLKIPWK